jgi:hypothetical protein
MLKGGKSPPTIREVELTYVELDVPTINYIMNLISNKQLTITSSSTPATKRIISTDDNLEGLDLCQGLDMVNVYLRQNNVSTI